jgi:mono/diheme cytochrome c family protein
MTSQRRPPLPDSFARIKALARLAFGMAGLAASTAGAGVDFQKDIAPVFAEHCLQCHGGDKAKGGLSFGSQDSAMKRLKSGHTAIIPGQPEKSEMLARLTSTDPEQQMPPPEQTKRPTAQQIALLREWIVAGAEWKPHWAYVPVQRPAVPAVKDAAQVRNAVDAFIVSGLEARGIAPSPEADRYTLIKRVYYDLLGLPPTPEEVDAFVADTAPDAFEKLVERTLVSPHFGERWGRHWLDMARYADSDGYEKDSPRPDAWRYRDWVISAVNADMPFDQFTIEQMAGDLLPNATPEQKLATAFHRQTLTNREGGVDQEQFRVEAVFDRTETIGSVWMGLTVGCARCHSHKYDQISQEEYYRLFAFFNNADETNTSVPESAAALAEYEKTNAAHMTKLAEASAALEQAREALVDKFPAWQQSIVPRLAATEGKSHSLHPLTDAKAAAEKGTTLAALADGWWLASGALPEGEVFTVTATLPEGPVCGLRLETAQHDSLSGKGPGRGGKGNFVVSELRVSAGGKDVPLHSPAADFSQKGYAAAGLTDGDAQTGWAISPQLNQPHHASVFFVHPLDGSHEREVTITLEQNHPGGTHALGHFRLAALTGESEESVAPKAVRGFAGAGMEKWTAPQREELLDWMAQFDPAARAAAAHLAGVKRAGPEPPMMDVSVVSERRKNPRATHVLHRGEFLSPAEAVAAGTPATLPPLTPRAQLLPDRLDLARWLMRREHPLTARVAVNHLWARLFGEGLVRTPGDFGVRGEPPQHPALLDWLAAEFMDRGWSRKHLLRTIMTSAAYRRSSQMRPDLRDTDPLNLLLARQNRVRVEGEIVRDLHLAASGLLSRKIGGPSVYPPLPPEVAAFSYADNFKWTESKGEDRYRRAMYTFFKRTAPHPDLMVFDCPDANLASVERNVSNTPLQALTTLNAQSFTDAAQALAARTLEIPGDDTARLTAAFRRCLGRKPSGDESAHLLSLLAKARATWSRDGKSGDGVEPAAWTATVRIILNTDEFITRD